MSNQVMQVAELAENVARIEQQRAMDAMLARSATDAEFRALMLDDAHAAFAAAGVEVAAELDIVFIENRADVTIVLPDALDEMVELSEAELESINGGMIATIISAVAELTSLSTPACAGAAISVGAVALTIYLAT
jgi:hypothetical protein